MLYTKSHTPEPEDIVQVNEMDNGVEVRDKPQVDAEPVPKAEPTPGITEGGDKGTTGGISTSNSSNEHKCLGIQVVILKI